MGTTQIGALPGTSGTSVETTEPAPGALPTPFGSTLMMGAFQWGPIDKVVLHSGQPNYLAERGTAMREDPTPTNCDHFYLLAKGAGRLLTVRLTDGTERQSVLDLYARDIGLDRLHETTPPGLPTRALRVQGLYSGRRGGQGDLLVGQVANRATNFNATAGSFDTGTAMITDQYKDALLYIEGVTRSYKVTSNDITGVLSIEVPSGDAGPPASAGAFTLVFDALDANGDRDGIGVQVDSSRAQPASEVRVQVHDLRKPAPVTPDYPSVGLDSSLDSYVEQVINVAGSKRRQHWITTEADPDNTIGDPSADDMRPANFVGMPNGAAYDRAVGTITSVATAALVDGESFAVPDGRRTVTFEFKVTAGHTVTAGRTELDVTAAVTAADVAAVVLAGINASALDIAATPDAVGVTYLTGAAGSFANQTITESVANAGFIVTGMAAGTGPTNFVDLLTWSWTRTSPGNGLAHVDPASVSYGAQSYRRVVAVCTFTGATAFTVEWKDWNEDITLATGGGVQALATAVNEGSSALPQFTLRAGADAMVATDVIKVYFQPLPQDIKLAGGKLYGHAHDQGDSTNDIRKAFNVRSNTQTRVTLPTSTDLTADHNVAAPGAPVALGAIAEPFNLAGGETFIYTINGGAAVTLTGVLVNAAATAALTAADLNALELVAHPTGVWVVFSDVGGKVKAECQLDFGDGATLGITTGTHNAKLGFTNNTDYVGSEGSAIALSWGQELERGLDGVALLGQADEYVDAWDVNTSPVKDALSMRLGLVKMGMPGVSGGSETDQNAAIAYGDSVGFTFRGEVDPTDAADEDDAAAYVKDNITGSRNRPLAWNSYGYPRRRPFTGVETSYPMTGAILGMEANLAAQRGGYHFAAAGTKANIGEVFESLASVAAGEDAPTFDESLLNPVGIQTVQQQGALIYPNGGRNSEDNYAGTIWKHKQESILHIMHMLRVAGDPFVWEDLSVETRNALVASVTPLFRDLYNAGWFIRTSSQSFNDVVQIQAGDDENPPEVQVLGELRATVTISGIIGTAERVVFALGTGGVTATSL